MSRRPNKGMLTVRLIVGLLCAKVLLLVWIGLGHWRQPWRSWVGSPAVAEAQEADRPTESDQTRRLARDEFLISVQERRFQQIREREKAAEVAAGKAKEEQDRLEQVKGDLGGLLEQIKELQAKVDKALKEKEEENQAKIKRLAKVYEETPAEKAGPMLSRLSPKMAAEILVLMNPRKAGKIWGQVDPAKGELISKELIKLKE
ncbi:MAG: hypothetical protein HY788_12130 [Deltaproteobacteria bacterium]|nr:hypothetical protein [Deltaproteobacteria bacterium]